MPNKNNTGKEKKKIRVIIQCQGMSRGEVPFENEYLWNPHYLWISSLI